MIKERIPISGDLGSKVKQPVSYTHLDVYKRQDQRQTGTDGR